MKQRFIFLGLEKIWLELQDIIRTLRPGIYIAGIFPETISGHEAE